MNINDFLTAWLELDADPLAVARRLSITVEQLARNLQTPEVRELLDVVDDLRARQHREAARSAQLAAGEHLRRSLSEAPTPIERRRAATTLARLAHQMLSRSMGFQPMSSSSPRSMGFQPMSPSSPSSMGFQPMSPSSPAPSGGGGRGSARPEGEARAPSNPPSRPPLRNAAPISSLSPLCSESREKSPQALRRGVRGSPSPATLLAAAGAP